MGYLSRVLLPSEAIDYRPQLSNMAQFGAPTLEFVAVVGAWSLARHLVLSPMTPEDGPLHQWFVIAYLVGLAIFVGRFAFRMGYRALRLHFRELAVTNRRFMEKDGVLRVKFWSTDLEKIVRVSIEQPILGRVFDYGAVTIITVGEVEHVTRGVARPIELQQALHARMAKANDPAPIAAPEAARVG